MSRYIDADLIEYEPMCRARGNGMYEDCETAHKDQIDAIPTADVRENVKGEWIYTTIENGMIIAMCSICKKVFAITPSVKEWYRFCPNCGADMRPITALTKNAEIDSNLKKR